MRALRLLLGLPAILCFLSGCNGPSMAPKDEWFFSSRERWHYYQSNERPPRDKARSEFDRTPIAR